jgi:hypothetical protein
MVTEAGGGALGRRAFAPAGSPGTIYFCACQNPLNPKLHQRAERKDPPERRPPPVLMDRVRVTLDVFLLHLRSLAFICG